MATIALHLKFCLLILGLAQCFENVVESQIGQLKQSASRSDKFIFFKAFLSEYRAYAPGSTIVFSDVQHNIGQAYNPSSGVFTAPVTGLYEFKYHVHRVTGVDADIVLFNQDRPRANAKSSKNMESYGISTFMMVEKGNHVFLSVWWTDYDNHITLRSGFYTQFMGYLIRQL